MCLNWFTWRRSVGFNSCSSRCLFHLYNNTAWDKSVITTVVINTNRGGGRGKEMWHYDPRFFIILVEMCHKPILMWRCSNLLWSTAPAAEQGYSRSFQTEGNLWCAGHTALCVCFAQGSNETSRCANYWKRLVSEGEVSLLSYVWRP